MGDRLPSLELVLALTQSERDKLGAHFESLDQKAGLVLAGAGVFVTLASGLDGPVAFAASGLGVLAVVSALAAFWPRDIPRLRASELRTLLRAEEEVTQLEVVDTLLQEEPQTVRLLEAKARRLKRAMALLATASMAAGLGAVRPPERGGHHERPQEHRAADESEAAAPTSSAAESSFDRLYGEERQAGGRRPES